MRISDLLHTLTETPDFVGYGDNVWRAGGTFFHLIPPNSMKPHDLTLYRILLLDPHDRPLLRLHPRRLPLRHADLHGRVPHEYAVDGDEENTQAE